MRAIGLDHPRLKGRRLHRVGVRGNKIFVQPSNSKSIEIWSLHTFCPGSWECVLEIPIEQKFYTFPSCSYHHPLLYNLVVAQFPGEIDARVVLYEVNTDTGSIKEYALDNTNLEFWNVSFEDSVLGCGENFLHFYDRGTVMGAIPYWNLILLENTFILERFDIADESGAQCSRFPIAIRSDLRLFARLKDDHSLLVHDAETTKWIPYHLSPSSHLNLNSLRIRGLNETYGRAGHRMGAIESPLTIYSDGPVTVARVHTVSGHSFYKIELDDELREFRCIDHAAARFPEDVDRMFYVLVSSTYLAMVSLRVVAVADMQPPTLAECAVWAYQKANAKRDEHGYWFDGLSIDEIAQRCGYHGKRPLIS